MKEKDFQIKFNHWIKEKYFKTACFELKQTKGDSLPFNVLKDHQLYALYNAKHSNLVYKIPDAGFQNPFDCFSLAGVDAFVVVKYPEFFCLIDIDMWITTRDVSVGITKSLSSFIAREIAHLIVND